MPKARNLTGQIFGRLTVIEPDTGRTTSRRKYWKCLCECGTEKSVSLGNLTSENIKSCGCLRKEILDKSTHGLYKIDPSVCGIWAKMVARCTKPESTSYKHYGGRGIKVCDRWLSMENFFMDMGPRPENTSLGRIDNDGDYEPENCRWETVEQQANNKQTTRRFTHLGKTQSMSQWAKEYGIPIETLFARLKTKTLEEALTMKGKRSGTHQQ